jgi:hypothetical protein
MEVMNNSKFFILLLLLSFLGGCEYDFPEKKLPSDTYLGAINAEKVIAIGDGWLAGVMDGSLYQEGQENSLGALIAGKLNAVSGKELNQATVDSENGYNFYESDDQNVHGKWVYRFENRSQENPKRVLTNGTRAGVFQGDKTTLSDFSVPALKVTRIDDSRLSENPYFERISSSANSTYMDEISKTNPSFAIVWLGMTDVIGFAANGATNQTAETEDYLSPFGPLPTVEYFRTEFNKLIDGLLPNTECKLVVGNLISIKNLPYFYLRKYNSLFLNNTKLGITMAHYRKFNDAVEAWNRKVPPEKQRPFIGFFDNGYYPHEQSFVAVDSSLSDATYPDGSPLQKIRKLEPDEVVLYNFTDEMIDEGYGSLIPLSEKNYLTAPDAEMIVKRITAFNAVISEISLENTDRIALVDINSLTVEIAGASETDAAGDLLTNRTIYFNGLPVEGLLGMNSIYSLDALHYNQRGNAYVANEFIKTINREFGAKIAPIDINLFEGNTFSVSY